MDDANASVFSDLEQFASLEGFERFWRICAGNAQGVSHPSVASLLLDRLGPESSPDAVLACYQSLAKLPAEMFADREGSAMFATLCRFNHSCQPNVVLQR